MTAALTRITTDRDRFNGQIRVLVRDRHEPAHVCVHWMEDREARGLGAALLRSPQTAPTGAPVIDSAEFAWSEVSWLGVDEFASDYRDDLDQAAQLLMQQALIDAWARRGRLVQLVDKHTFLAVPDTDTDPDVADYLTVWQEAADSIDLDALLAATDLAHEYTAHYQD